NAERYRFLKWAMQAFDGLRIVPPGFGICHQARAAAVSSPCRVRRERYSSPSDGGDADGRVATAAPVGAASGAVRLRADGAGAAPLDTQRDRPRRRRRDLVARRRPPTGPGARPRPSAWRHGHVRGRARARWQSTDDRRARDPTFLARYRAGLVLPPASPRARPRRGGSSLRGAAAAA